MRTLIHRISELGPVGPGMVPVTAEALDKGDFMHQAWVVVSDDRIQSIGTGMPPDGPFDLSVDADGGAVIPAFVDCHTHLVFAAWRQDEFVRKLRGESYADIARSGGGILNSASRLRDCSEDELFDGAWKRLNELMRLGTGAVEVKSGYGLTVESELKMLRVARRLGSESGIPVRTTFLGAHAVPAGMTKEDYVKVVIDEMIPAVSSGRLADFIDVFCEDGFFTYDETLRILEAGKRSGLVPRVHAHQLNRSGGVRAGVQAGARSVDHLEQFNDEDLRILKGSGVYPVLLPGAAFFLGLPFPPARLMQQAGLPIVVASDYNPGSSPSGNMLTMWSMACSGMRLSPRAALQAMTVNPACLMDLQTTHGSIAPGKSASLILTHPMPSVEFIPYRPGMPAIRGVMINGRYSESSTRNDRSRSHDA